MKSKTKSAIKMLLRLDDTVEPDVQMSIIDMMEGRVGDVAYTPKNDLTIAEASALLRLSHVTLWRMCKRGNIKYFLRGKKIMLSPETVEELRHHRKTSNQTGAGL